MEEEMHRMKAYKAFRHNAKQILLAVFFFLGLFIDCRGGLQFTLLDIFLWVYTVVLLIFPLGLLTFLHFVHIHEVQQEKTCNTSGQIWIHWPSLCIASILSAMLHPNSTLSCVWTHLKAPREKNKSDNSQEFRRLSLSTAGTCLREKNAPQLPLKPSLGHHGGQIVYISM